MGLLCAVDVCGPEVHGLYNSMAATHRRADHLDPLVVSAALFAGTLQPQKGQACMTLVSSLAMAAKPYRLKAMWHS